MSFRRENLDVLQTRSFIPVLGHLDDALVVAFVLRRLATRVEPSVAAEHWPGPRSTLGVVLRLARAGPGYEM